MSLHWLVKRQRPAPYWTVCAKNLKQVYSDGRTVVYGSRSFHYGNEQTALTAAYDLIKNAQTIYLRAPGRELEFRVLRKNGTWKTVEPRVRNNADV